MLAKSLNYDDRDAWKWGGGAAGATYDVTPAIAGPQGGLDGISSPTSYFNGGANFAFGPYDVDYVEGAMIYSGTDIKTNAAGAFRVTYTNYGGTQNLQLAPNDATPAYASYAAAVAGTLAQPHRTRIYASGGHPIGVFLYDNPVNDNAAVGTNPTPTWRLSTPTYDWATTDHTVMELRVCPSYVFTITGFDNPDVVNALVAMGFGLGNSISLGALAASSDRTAAVADGNGNRMDLFFDDPSFSWILQLTIYIPDWDTTVTYGFSKVRDSFGVGTGGGWTFDDNSPDAPNTGNLTVAVST
jgi:hypothetical protein